MRYGIIDYERLMELMGVRHLEQLQQACREQIEEAIQRKQWERQSQWSESLAVGGPAYVEAVRKQLGARARGRAVVGAGTAFPVHTFPEERGFWPGWREEPLHFWSLIVYCCRSRSHK